MTLSKSCRIKSQIELLQVVKGRFCQSFLAHHPFSKTPRFSIINNRNHYSLLSAHGEYYEIAQHKIAQRRLFENKRTLSKSCRILNRKPFAKKDLGKRLPDEILSHKNHPNLNKNLHQGGNRMRWFKHFSDNHRGRSIHALMKEMGHKGLAYYILMEMCAEKIEERTNKPEDFEFQFPVTLVARNCRLSTANVAKLCRICAEHSLLSYHLNDEFLELKIPIFLNLLDRDLKKSKKNRAHVAQKPRLETDKDKETDKDIKAQKDFVRFDYEKLYEFYPKKIGKTRGLKTCKSQIKTQSDYQDLERAIHAYSAHCKEKITDPKYIKQFDTFMSSWRDWLDSTTGTTMIAMKSEGVDWEEVRRRAGA